MNEQTNRQGGVEGNADVSHGPVQEGSVGPVQRQEASAAMITGQQDGPSEAPGYQQVQGGTPVDGRTGQSGAGDDSMERTETERVVTTPVAQESVRRTETERVTTTPAAPVANTGTGTSETIVVSTSHTHESSGAAVGGTARAELTDESEHAHADALLRPEAAERAAISAPTSGQSSGGEAASSGTPAGYASAGGQWPVRTDDNGGVHIDDGGEITTAMAAPGEALIPTRDSAMRASDAATGSGPYVDPGEDLERVGATSGLAANAGSTWNVAATGYRSGWEARGGGDRWEDAEPAYRYGHEMSGDARYQGRDFDQSEADLRRGYGAWATERGYHKGDATDAAADAGEGMWEKVKGGTKEAWDKVRGKG